MSRHRKEREWSHGLTLGSSVEILDGRGRSRKPKERGTVNIIGRAGFRTAERPMTVFWWVAMGETWRNWHYLEHAEDSDADDPPLGTAA